jgi:hypothetical protein
MSFKALENAFNSMYDCAGQSLQNVNYLVNRAEDDDKKASKELNLLICKVAVSAIAATYLCTTVSPLLSPVIALGVVGGTFLYSVPKPSWSERVGNWMQS